MLLTPEAFYDEGEQLVALSRLAARLQSSGGSASEPVAEWQWRHGRRSHLPGSAYLVSTTNARTWMVSTIDSSYDRHSDDIGQDDECDLEGDINDLFAHCKDDETVVTAVARPGATCDKETVLCEFHIVYHVIYQTPVLYFRATKLDGSPFRVDAHVGGLHLPGSKSESTVVSMEEHPVLGSPFWFLHPCETSSAMQLLMQQSGAREDPRQPLFLLAWLSLVAPLTHIHPQSYQAEV